MKKKIHSEETYNGAMNQEHLIENGSLSLRSVSRKLNIPLSTLRGWYSGKQPLFKFKKGLLERKNTKQILEDSHKLTPEKTYVFGVLCGDGYLNSKDGYVSLEVIDDDFIEKFGRCLVKIYGENFGGSTKPTIGKKKRLIVVGRKMVQDIEKNLPIYKTLNWRIPERIFTSDIACKTNFLKGIFDSEGSVHGKHSLDMTSINYSGLKDVKKLFGMIGIKVSDPMKSGNCYKLYITGKENILKFHEMVGFSIRRKTERLNNLVTSYNN